MESHSNLLLLRWWHIRSGYHNSTAWYHVAGRSNNLAARDNQRHGGPGHGDVLGVGLDPLRFVTGDHGLDGLGAGLPDPGRIAAGLDDGHIDTEGGELVGHGLEGGLQPPLSRTIAAHVGHDDPAQLRGHRDDEAGAARPHELHQLLGRTLRSARAAGDALSLADVEAA